MDSDRLYGDLGLDPARLREGDLAVHSPIDGSLIGRVTRDTAATVGVKIARARDAFTTWRRMPAPRRGELVSLYGEGESCTVSYHRRRPPVRRHVEWGSRYTSPSSETGEIALGLRAVRLA